MGTLVRLGGGICYLHVNVGLWARAEPTPLWLKVGDASGPTTDALRTALLAAGYVLHPSVIAGRTYSSIAVPLVAGADTSVLTHHTVALLVDVAVVAATLAV